MANLKEIRNRISSVKSTRQITSAMKMVSAAKLKRAQDKITQMRPYAEKLQEILGNLSASLSDEGAYTASREVKRVLLVPVTSNRGLCGAFNANIIKKINALIEGEFSGKEVHVMSVGKKASDFFQKRSELLPSELESNINTVYEDLNFATVSSNAEIIMKAYVDGVYDQVVVVYNQFKNAAMQNVMTEQFLPVVPSVQEESVSSSAIDYIYEPSKHSVVEDLVPKSLKIQFYKAILDSNAGEHGARMTAMHKATDNATDLINDLTLSYNKARQAAITGEILEIVGGAEALNA